MAIPVSIRMTGLSHISRTQPRISPGLKSKNKTPFLSGMANSAILLQSIVLIILRPVSTFEPSNHSYPEVAYEDVMSKDSGVLEWLENTVSPVDPFHQKNSFKEVFLIYLKHNWGFSFVKGIPVDPESTKTLIERIAFIRHTHYGIITTYEYTSQVH